ncbi:hypothetical protein H8E52_09180 [bacterium]|nr:hypothetical protein [bacterium]
MSKSAGHTVGTGTFGSEKETEGIDIARVDGVELWYRFRAIEGWSSFEWGA